MSRPHVLVLLAAYNGEPWITQQIETIRRQSAVTIDLIVRDDASTDGTAAAVSRLAASYGLTLVVADAPGGSAARNFLRLIRDTDLGDHDYVALADQDDLWHEDKLARACTLLAARGAAGYSCAVTAFWTDGRERLLRQVATPTRTDFLFEGAGQGCTFVLSAALYRRLQEHLRNDPAATSPVHYHDWAIYALARTWRLPWIFDAAPFVRYRQHDANDTGARRSWSGVTKRLRLIHGGWYRRELEAIARLCRAAAPQDVDIARWQTLLELPPGWGRRRRIARFCLRGGRRRLVDRIILVSAALVGWI